MAEIASAYEASSHVSAISVLTEPDYFRGGYENLTIASGSTGRPLLLKDFVIDEYQVMRGYLNGASAFLVISSITDEAAMDIFSALARRLGMAILFEEHSADEYRRALDLAPDLVGINNRDLATFKTSVDHTIRLVDDLGLPGDSLLISESGISVYDDISRLGSAALWAASLWVRPFMRQADIGAAIELLMTGRG